jgi:hypothetical protein
VFHIVFPSGCPARPVADHPLTRFGSGFLGLGSLARAVLTDCTFRVALAEVLPGVAFPPMVGALR